MNKVLTGLVAAVVLITAAASNLIYGIAEETPTSGKCGENATWSFDASTGILKISGIGDMNTKYTPVDQWEYYPYRNEITEVIIEDGITSVSSCAFGKFDPNGSANSEYPNLTKLKLPSTIRRIESYAFYKSGLTNITLPEGLEMIEESAFRATQISDNLNIPLTLNTIGESAFKNTNITSVNLHEEMTLGGCSFRNCNFLKEVTIPKDIHYKPTFTSNAPRPNCAFADCKSLEKTIIKGGGTVVYTQYGLIHENGIGDGLFLNCTKMKEIEIESECIEYVGTNDSDNKTFDMTNNPTFKVYKGSTTEQTLRDSGYLTTENTVYYDVDTTELEDAITKAKNIDTSKYTDESVNLFEKALTDAQAILKLELPLPSLVNETIKSLSYAVSTLVEKSPKPSNNSPTDSTSITASSTKKPPTTATSAKTNEKQVKQEHTKYINAIKKAKVAKPKVKSKSKKKIKVTWKKVKKAKGYQIQVSKKKNFKKNIINKTTTKKNITITQKIKRKKTYFIRVRAFYTYRDIYGHSKIVHSKWSLKLKIKVK